MSTAQGNKDPESRPCILIVDDEPLNVKLFALTLGRRGYRVLQARDGYNGFVLAHDTHPDLIVMDVQLPNLSGLEVTKALKDSIHTRDIPVVIMTAFLIDAAELSESRCDGYMAKPFVLQNFVTMIDGLIARSRDQGLDRVTAAVA